ncbi:MAG: phosphatidylinositol mannoside acyltransferase [Nocardioidaceae bacterium]|nr:phosphatidylinositol mannoside acyltransferase [Nocardioidaceae bacterium]
MSAAGEQAAATAYRLGWRLGARLPERSAYGLGDVAADAAWRRRGRGVRQLERNLSRASPGLDGTGLHELSRTAMRSYLRYWVEAFRLPRWSVDDVVARVILHDAHRLVGAYAEGRGVVAALPHTGNWDLAGAWACAAGMPLTTVAERLRPESLYRDFLAYRSSLGMEVLPIRGAGSSFRILVDRVRAGRFVPLLADRDLSTHGAAVDLLGEPASLPTGPARLAQITGAPLVPITCDFEPRAGAGPARMHLRMHPAVPPRPGPGGAVAMTADVAAVFSAQIAAHPADWHLLAPLFLADLATDLA